MKNIYTLIVYLPGEESWLDRCGDYNGGRESELNLSVLTDKLAVADVIAKAKFSNSDNQITLLINGLNIDNQYCADILSDADFFKLEKESDEIWKESEALVLLLVQEEKDRLDKERLLKEAEEAARKEKVMKDIENKERAELAKLMAKYSNN